MRNQGSKIKKRKETAIREGPCVGGCVHMCRLCACETVCTWKALDRWFLQLQLNVAYFCPSVKPLSKIESVLVSILIKVDSFNLLDSLLCISQVCLSCPHRLFLFDSGETREIRAVTFSAAFSAPFFSLPCKITEQCIKNHYNLYATSFSICSINVVLYRRQ